MKKYVLLLASFLLLQHDTVFAVLYRKTVWCRPGGVGEVVTIFSIAHFFPFDDTGLPDNRQVVAIGKAFKGRNVVGIVEDKATAKRDLIENKSPEEASEYWESLSRSEQKYLNFLSRNAQGKLVNQVVSFDGKVSWTAAFSKAAGCEIAGLAAKHRQNCFNVECRTKFIGEAYSEVDIENSLVEFDGFVSQYPEDPLVLASRKILSSYRSSEKSYVSEAGDRLMNLRFANDFKLVDAKSLLAIGSILSRGQKPVVLVGGAHANAIEAELEKAEFEQIEQVGEGEIYEYEKAGIPTKLYLVKPLDSHHISQAGQYPLIVRC